MSAAVASRTCVECGGLFWPRAAWEKTQTCSVECYRERGRRRLAARLGVEPPPRHRACERCAKPFVLSDLTLVGVVARLCASCRKARRAERERAWWRTYQGTAQYREWVRQYRRRIYVPRPRPVAGTVLFDLRDDLAQERFLAELEGREFDMREFKRANCPYRERTRIPDWKLYGSKREEP